MRFLSVTYPKVTASVTTTKNRTVNVQTAPVALSTMSSNNRIPEYSTGVTHTTRSLVTYTLNTTPACVYKGVQYAPGQKFYDGCQYICKCIDPKAGQYSCSERCAKLTILPSSCILISDPRDPACCTVPFCPPNPVTTEAPNNNPQPGTTTAPGSRGKEFLVLFTPAYFDDLVTKSVYITSDNGAEMNISTSQRLDPNLKSQIDRTDNISTVEHIIFPIAFELKSFKKELKSAIIKTSKDVFVISHDDGIDTVGSTTHIPLHKLSTKYTVVSITNKADEKSQMAIASIQDGTVITITFHMEHNMPLLIEGKTYHEGDMFTLNLDHFETYLIEHTSDLTGTAIESSHPIAVFSGNDCAELDSYGACDHLVEQLPPITSVDTTYIVPPNSDNRDTLIRITAIDDSNFTYTIDRVSKMVELKRLDSFGIEIDSRQTCLVESDRSIFVTRFGLHSKTSEMGDPSMTIVPGIHQYLDYYKIVVPPGYNHNYVSIMMKQFSTKFLRINGNVLNVKDMFFEENVVVGQETYTVRSINLIEGEISVYSTQGDRFGLMFAGVTDYEAYGFSGNSLLP
uniref:IgGFc-binding protein-like isoform X3 n=1 Tax=Crassostrea virginica TaxID=6565 RepID=A0A8B8C5V6_CRAVI|nr:IgGFc-binding protein-like isoform X3 [Crassostrea virginica]